MTKEGQAEPDNRAPDILIFLKSEVFLNWMTLDDVTLYLQISKETVYRYAQKGQIPAAKIGSQWRFDKETIDEWLKAKMNFPEIGVESTQSNAKQNGRSVKP